jgi:methylmalonyl-CoA/ethylmalonyl-CoA epimerase
VTNQELREFNKKRTIRQICVVTKDIDQAMKHWVEYLGIGPWRVIAFTEKTITGFEVAGKPVTEPFKFILAFADVGGIEFELVQPVYGPNIYRKFLEERGEGLHHIKEKISDENMEKVVADFRKKGIEVTQTGLFQASRHYYLNTEPFVDIIYELGNCPVQTVPPEIVRVYPEEQTCPGGSQ